ncbi:MAG: TonB-dependent receptor [Sphingomonadales bacterium]|nr:TonB-dependent receptor [Sphingomonadales bacterium]MDE2569056.1 TonB-dependent receptor [Sphingomonadales bacterium]
MRLQVRSICRLLAAASLVALAVSAPARAASAPVVASAPAGNIGKSVYTPADFTRFAPKTALDMLSEIPGFSIREPEQARGLSQASGNVVVNSARLTSKSDDVRTQLSRIPASSVERIEIVDGATLDVPGLTGQVANVIARSDAFSGSFKWAGQVRPHYAHPLFTDGEISVTGRKGRVQYTLSLTDNAGRGGAGGPTVIRDSSGAVTETRDDVVTNDYDSPKLSAAFHIDGPGSAVGNISASYQWTREHDLEHSNRTPVGGQPYRRELAVINDTRNREFSADYEFAVGPGRLKLIAQNRKSHEPYFQSIIFFSASGNSTSGDSYRQLGEPGETIGRGEYSWKMLGGDWQLAGEAAFNSLDNAAFTGTLGSDGTFVETPFAGGTAGVREDRYETSISHGRPLAPNLTMQLIAGSEWSTIRQTGTSGKQRSFFRPKGSLSLAWKPSARFDLSLKLQRRVGQLSFYDFLARQFLDNGNANSGNADLVPQQDWTLEAEANRSFGPWGSAKLRFYGRQVVDYVTVVPIGANGESVGNVPSAKVRSIEFTGTLQFDPLGWKGAKLDVYGLYQYTRLPDPLTGAPIAYSGISDKVLSLTLRDDIPGSSWAWGGEVQYSHQSLSYRLGEFGRDYEGPVYTSLFIESKNVFGMTVKGEVFNLNNGRQRWDRVVHTGRRGSSPVAFTETRNRLIGPIFILSVKGNF